MIKRRVFRYYFANYRLNININITSFSTTIQFAKLSLQFSYEVGFCCAIFSLEDDTGYTYNSIGRYTSKGRGAVRLGCSHRIKNGLFVKIGL